MSANPGSIHRKRWEQVKTLFQRAYPLDERERGDFLSNECHGDPDLRTEVEALLASDDSTCCLDRPPVVKSAAWYFDKLAKRMVGTRIGPFRVERGIAVGGMGEVFLATRVDGHFDQTVAIKILKLGMDSEDLLGRFRAERMTLAALEHPNIARLIDGGSTADGRPYFAMEYVCGTQIDRYCDDHNLTVFERLELFLTVCGAVHYAHQNLVVHRDLKPGNILVTDDGVPKLLDFGIAKLLTPALDGDGTAMLPGQHRLLTPFYASPEQIRGTRITTASDVYSLGLVLYKMLTGYLPFQVDDLNPRELDKLLCEIEVERPSQFIERDSTIEVGGGNSTTTHQADSPIELRSQRADQLRRRLRGDIDNIVLMALRKDPLRRYASVEQFASDIRRHLTGQPVVARKDTTSYRLGKFFKRNKAAVASAVVMAITLTAGFANSAWQSSVVRTERDYAVEARKQAETLTAFLQKTLFSASPDRQGADATVFELLEDAAGRINAELGRDGESKADVHYAIGATYAALGNYAPANRHLRAALIYSRLNGSDQLRTVRCLKTLGFILADQEEDDSVALLEEALTQSRGLYGDDHPLVARIQCNLAYALWHAAEPPQLARSETLMHEALQTYRLHFTDGDLHFADWTHDMGGVRIGQNRPRDAIEFYQRARNMYLAADAENNPHYIALLKHMALALDRLNRYAKARTFLSEYLDRRRVVFGAEWVTEDDLWWLATFDTISGSPANALRGYQSWLILRCKNLAKGRALNAESALAIQAFLQADLTLDHPESASHYHNVVTTLKEQGLLRGTKPQMTLYRMGRAYCELGNYRGAEMLLEGCTKLRKDLYDYTPCPDVVGWLGVTKVALGQYESAATHLFVSYQVYAESFGHGHERTDRAIDRLADLYRSWGRPDQAEWISEALCQSNDPIDPSDLLPSNPIP